MIEDGEADAMIELATGVLSEMQCRIGGETMVEQLDGSEAEAVD